MQQEVDKLQIQLEIPRDDHMDGMNYVADLPKREKMPFTSEFIPSLVGVDRFSLLSGPNEVKHLYEDENLQMKPPMAGDPSFGWHSAKVIRGALDSRKKPLFVNDEDSLFQADNFKLDKLQENILLRNLSSKELTKAALSHSPIEPPESASSVNTEVLCPPLQNDHTSYLTPSNYAAQFLKEKCDTERGRMSDVTESSINSKKSNSPVIFSGENDSFDFLASQLLSKYQYQFLASAENSPEILNKSKERNIPDSLASVLPTTCTCKERKCRCIASDQFESSFRTWLENSSTMPSIKSKLCTGLSFGEMSDTRAKLNIEMENSIKEIEKELGQSGFHREDVNTHAIAESEEPQVVELFRHNVEAREKHADVLENVRSIASDFTRVISTIDDEYISMEDKQPRSVLENIHSSPVMKDEVECVPQEIKESNNIISEEPNANGKIGSLSLNSKLLSNHVIANSSSIPLGTGQNSDILRLNL